MNTTEPASSERLPIGRVGHLILTGAIVVAFIGFFIGIGQGVPRPESEPRVASVYVPPGAALPALSYAEMREADIGPNASWRSDLNLLSRAWDREPPSPDEAAAPEAKVQSLASRASNRAYAGAPPSVPHAVDQFASASSCMACHGAAVRIGDAVASSLPHEFMTNCLQCHAPEFTPTLGDEPLSANRFAGVTDPPAGDRAWTGAPPVIPHTTFMRQNCLSCHGPQGDSGLRTSHPWRTECLQCHVSSSVMEGDAPSRVENMFLAWPRSEESTNP
ncbi:MAG: diheme cytochrome c precursor [Phycisphaerales bacterium]